MLSSFGYSAGLISQTLWLKRFLLPTCDYTKQTIILNNQIVINLHVTFNITNSVLQKNYIYNRMLKCENATQFEKSGHQASRAVIPRNEFFNLKNQGRPAQIGTSDNISSDPIMNHKGYYGVLENDRYILQKWIIYFVCTKNII